MTKMKESILLKRKIFIYQVVCILLEFKVITILIITK